MAVGGNKSKSTSTQASSQAMDPLIKSTLMNNVQQAQNMPAFVPFSGERVAAFSPTQLVAQQQALDMAGQHVGSDVLAAAASAAKTATGYAPSSITAGGYSPTAAVASTVNRGDVRDVTAGAVSPDAIKAYQDPFTQNVVDASAADLEHARQVRINQAQGQALRNKAFGGSGSDVSEALANEDFTRQGATQSAALRSQGFSQALAAAQADASRKLTADTSNQGVDLSVAGHNADLSTGANQFNAGQTNEADRFGATQDFAAQQANQQAGLAANSSSLTGANLMAEIANQARQAAVGDINLVGQVGDQQQGQQQALLDSIYQEFLRAKDDPFKRQELLNQTMALLGNQALTQSSATSSGKSSGFSLDVKPPA